MSRVINHSIQRSPPNQKLAYAAAKKAASEQKSRENMDRMRENAILRFRSSFESVVPEGDGSWGQTIATAVELFKWGVSSPFKQYQMEWLADEITIVVNRFPVNNHSMIRMVIEGSLEDHLIPCN